jgi:hypothetical protein
MEDQPTTKSPRVLTLPNDAEIYNFLTRYYLHQDQLSWSRIQTIVAIEGAVLAGALAKGGLLACGLLAFGALVIWLLWKLINRDWQVRDQDLDLLDQVHKPKGIRLTTPPIPSWASGQRLLSVLVGLIMGFDALVAVVFLFRHFA